MASAAARAVAAKKAHERKRTNRHSRVGGGKVSARVYEIDDVDGEDRLRLGQDGGVNKAVNDWKNNVDVLYQNDDGSGDDDSDEECDELERSIRDDDDLGCTEKGKCCGKPHGGKCCTPLHKRRPYFIDMDDGREGALRYTDRDDGTKAYKVNKFFMGVINSKPFGTIVLVAILCVTFLIGAGTYTTKSDTLSTMENCVQAWFVMEIVTKMCARGPTYYFCQYWNIFDFLIVTVTLLPTSWFGSGGGSSSIAILRLLRLLRMAKLMKVDAVEAIISGLSKGMKSLFYIMLLLFLVYYVFAILGMMLFGQNDPMHFRNLHDALLTLFRVSTLEDWTDIMYLNMFGCGYTGYEYPSFSHPGATGKHDDPQWDALIVNCTNNHEQCLQDDWIEVAVGTGITNLGSPIDTYPCLHPSASGWVSAFYFIIFVVISALVMLSLFIGLVSSEIETEQHRIKEEKRKKAKKRAKAKGSKSSTNNLVGIRDKETTLQRFTKAAKNWFDEDNLRLCRKQVFDEEKVKNSGHLRAAKKVKAITDHLVTQCVILLAIMVAAIAAGVETQDNGETQSTTDLIEKVEVVILIVFGLEMVALVFAEGTRPWYYFREKMNCFDFVIVVVCLISMLLPSSGEGGSAVQALRMLRLLRLLKLLDEIPELKQIVVGLQSGLSSIFFITCIMVLVYYLYAVVGLMMFQDNDPHHFTDLHNAMISLFRASTFEDWTDIMYINYLGCDKWGYSDPLPDPNNPLKTVACTDSNGGSTGAIVYFLSFVVVNAFIVLSLFIGVVTSSMIDARSEALRNKLEAELRGQLEKKFPVWLGHDAESIARVSRLKAIFREIDDDDGGFLVLDELSDWLSDQKVPWSRERRGMLLDGLVVARDDPVIKDELNFSQFIRLHKATELGMTPKQLQHDCAITQGRLQVSMHWRPQRPPQMQIEVTVIECEGLTQMDKFLCFTGENDPYVRVTVAGVNKQTDFIDGGGANPKWNADGQAGALLPFEISALPEKIFVRAYDEDEASADDLIGIGKIDLTGKPSDEKWFLDDHWVQLYDSEDSKGAKQTGRVKVKVKFDHEERKDAKEREDARASGRPSTSKTAANLHHASATVSTDDGPCGQFEFSIKRGKNLTPQVRCTFIADHYCSRYHDGKQMANARCYVRPCMHTGCFWRERRLCCGNTWGYQGRLSEGRRGPNDERRVEPWKMPKLHRYVGRFCSARSTSSRDTSPCLPSCLPARSLAHSLTRAQLLCASPFLASTGAEATSIAEDSDEEDEIEDPYMWRSETVDGGGSDPEWFAGGETKTWELCTAPKWVLIRAMDEDLDDDDHIGTGVLDVKKFFKEKLDSIQIVLEDNQTLVESIVAKDGRNAVEAKIQARAQEDFLKTYGCSLEDLESGLVEWHCDEWIDVKRETPDSIVDSGIEVEDLKMDPEGAEEARKMALGHMEDQKLLCHLMKGGTIDDVIAAPTPAKTRPDNLPM
jgi:voltage-gated sodium channel